MKKTFNVFSLILGVLFLAGCVTSHYTNDKGQECTRRYLTVLGIPIHSCSDTVQPVAAAPGMDQGTELKIAPAAPSPSLRQTTPAKTIEQNIRSTAAVR